MWRPVIEKRKSNALISSASDNLDGRVNLYSLFAHRHVYYTILSIFRKFQKKKNYISNRLHYKMENEHWHRVDRIGFAPSNHFVQNHNLVAKYLLNLRMK